MSKLKELLLSALQLYTTAPYACSYLGGRLARFQVAMPACLIDADVYSKLVCTGLRCSGIFTYRPHCGGCCACTLCRVVVDQCPPSRAQCRAAERHRVLEALIAPLIYVEEHYQLYLLCQSVRHADDDMDHNNRDQYEQFLLQGRINPRLVEFRGPPESSSADKLCIINMIGVLEDGLSSVYTFYDPIGQKASHETYNVLWQIAQAQGLDLPYVYLGYWTEQSRKTAYKVHFQPLELPISGKQRRSEDMAPQAVE